MIPSSPAYRVFISQLILYATACCSYECFILGEARLSCKPLGQGYVRNLNGRYLGISSSKIEKVPRGIRGEKSSKDMASSRNLVSTIGASASLKMGTEPGVRKGKRSLLACHTCRKCSMETSQFGKSHIKVI